MGKEKGTRQGSVPEEPVEDYEFWVDVRPVIKSLEKDLEEN